LHSLRAIVRELQGGINQLPAVMVPGNISAMKRLDSSATEMWKILRRASDLTFELARRESAVDQPIAPILERVLEKYSKKAQASGIDIVRDIDPGIEASAYAALLEEAFENVVANAVRKGLRPSFPDGRKKWLRVSLSGSRPGWATVRFQDNGCGIEPLKLDSIQWGKPTPESPSGSGNGLQLTRLFCEYHGGDFKIVSKLNEGTKVTLSIPCRR
jgi:signal transduction histidine kinase